MTLTPPQRPRRSLQPKDVVQVTLWCAAAGTLTFCRPLSTISRFLPVIDPSVLCYSLNSFKRKEKVYVQVCCTSPRTSHCVTATNSPRTVRLKSLVDHLFDVYSHIRWLALIGRQLFRIAFVFFIFCLRTLSQLRSIPSLQTVECKFLRSTDIFLRCERFEANRFDSVILVLFFLALLRAVTEPWNKCGTR